MKVFLDDERPTPNGWIRTYTPKETITLLQSSKVTYLSLDHDLGDDQGIGTGYDVLLWIEEHVITGDFIPPTIFIHSSNASAKVKMDLAIDSIYINFNRKKRNC